MVSDERPNETTSRDILERLRDPTRETEGISRDCDEAADEIERLRAVAEMAAQGSAKLQAMYDAQDAERRAKGSIGSLHRDIFESWLDALAEDAGEALK